MYSSYSGYIKNIYPNALYGYDKEVFLQDYPEVYEAIRAVALIAKHMHNFLQKHNKEWSIVGTTGTDLSKRIQGSLSPDLLMQSMKVTSDGNTDDVKALINAWINQANNEQLENFLKMTTGSSTLLPDKNIFFKQRAPVGNENEGWFFHTCSSEVELIINFQNLPKQADFNENLDLAIGLPSIFNEE